MPTIAKSSAPTMTLPKLPKLARAPEFAGLGPWHNAKPFTLASQKGKVVLVDFWTYSCINCIRTLPYIRGYWQKYKPTDKFVLIGVHTPEFTFEQSESNVASAIKRHGLTYPVAQDNAYGTWEAFSNHYWPAKYLIDADGYIRYAHFGEGNYEETDLAIASLLQEIGVDVSRMTPMEGAEEAGRRNQTPETYFSSRSWTAFGNSAGSPNDIPTEYKVPAALELNNYYLVGTWQLVDDEYETLVSSEGEIRMNFLGAEMNLVLGLENSAKSVQADVFIDGKKTKTITIDRYDLFNIFAGDYGEHEMTLKIHGRGVRAYAFTFGS